MFAIEVWDNGRMLDRVEFKQFKNLERLMALYQAEYPKSAVFWIDESEFEYIKYLVMKKEKTLKIDPMEVFDSIRKPMPPPTKVFKDKKKYNRKNKHPKPLK